MSKGISEIILSVGSEVLIMRELAIHDVKNEYVSWLNNPEVNQYLEVRHFNNTLETCKEFVELTNSDPCS